MKREVTGIALEICRIKFHSANQTAKEKAGRMENKRETMRSIENVAEEYVLPVNSPSSLGSEVYNPDMVDLQLARR